MHLPKVLLSVALALVLSSPVICQANQTNTKLVAYTPVQHNGRIKPFDSFANQTLKFLANQRNLGDRNAISIMAAVTAEPSLAKTLEWIRIDYFELKDLLGLPHNKILFSWNEIGPHEAAIQKLVVQAKSKRDKDERPTKLEQKAEELYGKFHTVAALANGENFKMMPTEGSFRINLEVFYNRFAPFEWAAVFYFLAFLFFTFFKKIKYSSFASFILLAFAVEFHTLGIALRVIILSRPPVSNMYESMIFMNWALIIFALIFSLIKKSTPALVVGSLVSGFVMLYGNLLPLDTSLDVLVPVLRSNYWLTIHVMTVVASYGAFGLAMGLGHRHLILQRLGKLNNKSQKESADLIFKVIQLGALLIGTGTVLGGVWANESWGRFWGWDPKETWALITFLGYLIIVHLRMLKKMDDFWLAMSSVLGFLLVLMTWYGVNFVLGRGLHSYGRGAGGMEWVVYYLVLEATFVGWVGVKNMKIRIRE